MKRVLCTGFLALVPLGVTACGGDDGIPITSFPTPTVTTQALTKADYITKADAVCAEANAALGSLAAADAATLATQQVDIYQNLVEQLNTLGLPTEDQVTLDQYLAAIQEILDNQEKITLAQERGDTTSTAEFTTAIATAQSAAATAAETYGFNECGAGATATTTPAPGTGEPAPAPTAPTTPPAAPAPGTGGGTGGGGTGGGGGGGGGSGGVGAP